jgi:hypothetical protein
VNIRLALGGVVLLLTSCSSESEEASRIASLVNENATQMLEAHVSERIVIYHPESGVGSYSVRLEKHFPCPADPCEAPAGQHQGMLRFAKAGKEAGPGGMLERWISVPEVLEVTRKDQDTAIFLQNKGWYAEVRKIY